MTVPMASTSASPFASPPAGQLYLLVCSTTLGPDHLDEFRVPELESIAALYDFTIEYEQPLDISRPFMVVRLPSEREARLIGRRSVSVRHVWEFWGRGKSYEEVHAVLKSNSTLWARYKKDVSWKFLVTAFGRNIQHPERSSTIDSFSFLGFEGPIDFKAPQLEVGVFEDYLFRGSKKEKGRDLTELLDVYVGRKICDSQRHLMDVYDLKKRTYIGTTSMDAEVSLLMANQALAAPGKLIYDPFAGTGSMLLTSATFGAVTFGSDIDGRQIRGKSVSIVDNAAQYGLEKRVLDCAVFDVTQHPFRTGEIFDAIVTDPPYGVRAGAKRLGRKVTPDSKPYIPKPVPGHGDKTVYTYQLPGYVPPTTPWEMASVISTLISLSLYLLTPGGRLVFFLPTDAAVYKDSDIPAVAGMRLISNSEQRFGKWARRLVTMEKVGSGVSGRDAEPAWDRGVWRGEAPKGDEGGLGHSRFRERYFEHFE